METAYGAAKKRTEPYTKIVGELPEMQGNTVGLVKKVVGENQRVYGVGKNRSKRTTPLSMQA